MLGKLRGKQAATTPKAAPKSADLTEVLIDEFKLLHGAAGLGDEPTLGAFHEAVHALVGKRMPRTALCLSGGGIRSASFALGVLQALAKRDLLDKFTYLSTVSGGGYIGSWLSAWRKLAKDDAKVMAALSNRDSSIDFAEPAELQGLRANSSYLTPKVGVMSADTWTLAALYIRNLLLNWVIYLPMFIAILLIPVCADNFLVWARPWPSDWHHGILVVAIVLLVFALMVSVKGRIGRDTSSRVGQVSFLWFELVPTYIAAILVCIYSVASYRNRADGGALAGPISPTNAAIVGAVIYGFAWLVAWIRHAKKSFWSTDQERTPLWLVAPWATAGALAGALIGWGCNVPLEHLLVDGNRTAEAMKPVVIIGVGWIAVSMFLAESAYLAITSYWPQGDVEREWLARSSGWFVVLTIGWAVLSALVLYAPDLVKASIVYFLSLSAVGGGAGAVAAAIGASAKTIATLAGKRVESLPMTKVLALGSIAFLLALTAVLSALLPHLVAHLDWGTTLTAPDQLARHQFCVAAAIIAGCVVIVLLASLAINVNRFSSHAMYRNRLTRAFLGSARGNADAPTRDPFTGFDDADNLAVAGMTWPPEGTDKPPRLFHVLNMALNVVGGKNNAWQERKAEPFVVTPRYSGNERVDFWPSDDYARGTSRDTSRGITLGTAMAISGAAASPNQGYHSSPLIGFIMTLFNVRLGWWLGNPKRRGKANRQGPMLGIYQTLQELFGLTRDSSGYVYLSDGGHFENLGLYEMVRRRCHFILASDGGCDPDCAFEDLGNAVRKIWIDLGVKIEFQRIQIRKRGLKEPALYCALGRIRYPEDQKAEHLGYVLYVKPGFHGDGTEPPDVSAYALANLTFPHETTADQFFTESQMESYRSLGDFIIGEILGEAQEPPYPEAPTDALKPYWKRLSTYLAQFDKKANAAEPSAKSGPELAGS